jgi:hypothetical protein
VSRIHAERDLRQVRRAAVLGGILLLAAGCGFGPSGDVKEIDPLSLPPRLFGTTPPISTAATPAATPAAATATATATEPMTSGSGTYFLSATSLRLSARPLSVTSGIPALQEMLNHLAAGPDDTERARGLSTALTPTTRLTVTSLQGGLATVDLAFGRVPPNQITAIAQIVLTATSLPEVNRLLLTIDGKPLQAPLADGALTDRPLTRSDYLAMLAPAEDR